MNWLLDGGGGGVLPAHDVRGWKTFIRPNAICAKVSRNDGETVGDDVCKCLVLAHPFGSHHWRLYFPNHSGE